MIEFMASFHKTSRDSEDETTLQLKCDAQQIDEINKIPAGKLLRVQIIEEVS